MSNNQSIDIEKFSNIFKALSSPSRLRIFLRLTSCCKPGTACGIGAGWRTCIGELGKDLGIGPSTVSHHIKELHRAGLIRTQRRGQMVECWVDPEIIHVLTYFFIEASQDPVGSSPGKQAK